MASKSSSVLKFYILNFKCFMSFCVCLFCFCLLQRNVIAVLALAVKDLRMYEGIQYPYVRLSAKHLELKTAVCLKMAVKCEETS